MALNSISASSGDSPNYAPTHSGGRSKYRSYASNLERLGFKITASTQRKRDSFLNQVKAHVDGSVYKYLRPSDNELAFHTMVSEFLAQYGEEFWGQSNREHLAEPDVLKGFYYPRDAHGQNSRLVEALKILFGYKASRCVDNRVKKNGWSSSSLDFKAMTGRKAESWTDTVHHGKRKPMKSTTSSGEKTHTHGDDPDPWNVFDSVLTNSKLRPRTSIAQRGKRQTSTDEEEDPDEDRSPSRKPRSKRHRARLPASESLRGPQSTTKKTLEGTRTSQLIGSTILDSSSDSEQPLSSKRQPYQPLPPTPSLSHAPSATPVASQKPFVIDLDASPERKLHEIKHEPMFIDHQAKTILLVTASNDDKAAITVPFTVFKETEDLFSTLIGEQELKPELNKKVKRISATYTWNKTRRGIRRGREDDLAFFYKTVQKAWGSEADKFEDECYIEMVLHVEE